MNPLIPVKDENFEEELKVIGYSESLLSNCSHI